MTRAKRQFWKYGKNEKLWVGKYRNSDNVLHWHYDCELLYVEEGRLEVFCDGKIYDLDKGRALFIDSEQIHYMQYRSPNTILRLFVFDRSIIDDFSCELRLPVPLLQNTYPLSELYDRLYRELSDKKDFYSQKCNRMLSEQMLEIFRLEGTYVKDKKQRATGTLKNLLKETEEKIEYFSFDLAADYMNMHPAYFSRYFHKTTGMTFSAYLNRVKINKAVELLLQNEDLQITEIAERCGFSTIRNFNRTFKAITGYAPTSLPKDYAPVQKLLFEDIGDPSLQDCVLMESSSTTKK